MEFLSLICRRSSARNVPSGEERGETYVFTGYYRFVIPKYFAFPYLILENNIDAQNVAMHMDVAIQGINRGFATDELIPNVQLLILLRPESMNELMGF